MKKERSSTQRKLSHPSQEHRLLIWVQLSIDFVVEWKQDGYLHRYPPSFQTFRIDMRGVIFRDNKIETEIIFNLVFSNVILKRWKKERKKEKERRDAKQDCCQKHWKIQGKESWQRSAPDLFGFFHLFYTKGSL